ncbi:MAG: energy transducer TonB [Candidatus Angelobacter sp. Gp1-AA117]|nr:MAG: energy transducer TonB [Candidatus Angelobacter sp. Gp1-AA117]
MSPLDSKETNAPQPPDRNQTSVIKFVKTPPEAAIIPTLFGEGYGTYQVRPENFLLSFVTHTLVIGLMLWLLHFTVQIPAKPEKQSFNTTILEPYNSMKIGKQAGGGGGGGDASKLKVSAGTPPKATMQQQLAPPVVIQPQQQSKLMVTPTIVADLKIPQGTQIGDPLSKLTTPSNGAGVGSGIGNGSGGGVGSGDGRGLGPGSGANFGGGLFRVGNGVAPPVVIFNPDPDYSDEARKAKYQGTVVLNVIVGADGRVYNPSIARSLGMGLDEKAIERVKEWKFKPATKDGKPVPVQVNVEVSFNLY